MNTLHRSLGGLVALGCVACATESDQTLPVTTRTKSGTYESTPSAQAKERDQAMVRFVHAIHGAGAVDLVGEHRSLFEAVPYGSTTRYMNVPAEDSELAIRSIEDRSETALATAETDLDAGYHYTAVAFRDGQEGTGTLVVLPDALTAPPADRAKVRFVHACTGLEELDVHVSTRQDALLEGLAFQECSEWIEVEPARFSLAMHREGEATPWREDLFVSPEAGQMLTVVLTGDDASDSPFFEMLLITDELGVR